MDQHATAYAIDLQFSSCASGEGPLPIAPLYGVMHAGLSHARLRQASWRGQAEQSMASPVALVVRMGD